MTSDLDLLRQFTQENSQDAFSEIVRRHVNLVYSAALRQVRSPQLAEEVAQSVFADLAKDARKLKPDTILTAWLYAVARRTAIDTVRKETRRQLREQIAVEMNDMNATAEDWTQISPLLDDAMAALDETERTAILLRFFENKSLREVGESLAISDDAAQKRVSRAVESLREFFSKQRLTIGAGGLAVLISDNAVKAAPVGLAGTISTGIIVAGSAVQTSTLITTTKAITMTALQKSLIIAGLAVIAGVGTHAAHENSELRGEIQSIEQQQQPLSAEFQRRQAERDDATNQLEVALVENDRGEFNSKDSELSRLRQKVALLKAKETQRENDPLVAAAEDWLRRVKTMKDYFDRHPEEKIPECQYLNDKDWLGAAYREDFISTDDLENAINSLKFDAESDFGQNIGNALHEYRNAHNGKFPDNLSELRPYYDPDIGSLVEQLYEIAPSSIVHDTTTNINTGIRMNNEALKPNMLGQWVITRKVRPNPASTSRLAIFDGGSTYWQSPPGSDDSR